MKKYIALFCSLLLTLSLGFAFSVSAASEPVVYVKNGGTGNGSSADSPLGSLSSALSALGGKGGKIVVVGDVTVSSTLTIPEQNGDLVITSQNGAKLLVSARIQLAKNTNSNTVTFDIPVNMEKSAYIFGGFNNIVFTKNFTVSGSALNFYGGVLAGEAKTNEACITELPYSIEVNGGTFANFAGGNLRNGTAQYVGSIAAPVTITINGGTFGTTGDYSAALSPNKSFNAFNVSGMNILADDATLNINGGTFHTPIYVVGRRGAIDAAASQNSTVTASNKKYYAMDGNITVNITGGSFGGGAVCAFYVDASYTQLLRGNYTVNVSGGTFAKNTVFDATQVKAYTGKTQTASITYADGLGITANRFDTVNGKATSYDEPLRIVFIGDSITEGYVPTTEKINRLTQSYPSCFLANALAANKDVIISNLGVSSAGMRPCAVRYYPDMLACSLAIDEVDADYYVFAIGTNDCNYAGGSNGTLLEYYDRYTDLIKACGDLATTKKVFLTSAILRCGDSEISPQYNMRAVALIRPTQEQIAKELAAAEPQKYTYIDLYALTYEAAISGKLLSSDKLHPSTNGYAIMGDVVYDAVFNGVCTNDTLEMTDIYVSAAGKQFGKGTKDDPTSSLAVAFGKCAPNATIHIMGTYTCGVNINTPLHLEKLTIVGEGTDAVLNLTSDSGTFIMAGSDLKIDNLLVKQSGGSAIILIGRYNDIELTESFRNEGKLSFYAGYAVQASRDTVDLATATHYDTEVSASSSQSCTVILNGGTFTDFMLGNRRLSGNAPLGTYSGNMQAFIGENVSFASGATYRAINGHNYLTGNVNVNVNSWPTGEEMADFAPHGTLAGSITYNASANTGKTTITVDGEAPVVTEVPATTAAPVTTNAPATTTAPVTTDAPATTTASATSEAPATTKAPITTEAPVTTAAPVTTQASVPTESNSAPVGLLAGIAAAVAAAAVIVVGVLKKKKK